MAGGRDIIYAKSRLQLISTFVVVSPFQSQYNDDSTRKERHLENDKRKSACVCVCVCERESERGEKRRYRKT